FKDLAVHEKQQVNLEERKKHANGKGKKLTKKSLQENSKARDEALLFIETNSEKIEKEKKKHAKQESSLEKEEKVLEGIRDSLKDKTQKELQPWMAEINTKEAEVDVAVSERDTLAKKAEAVKNSLNEAQESLANIQGDHDANTAELQELKENRGSLKEDVRAGEKKQQLQARLKGKLWINLTKLRDTGRISGFHGRLGNLGTIAEKYDVATSTACPALNNLIVDSVKQGQACIEYLRKQSVGRASFIVLEKLSPTNGLEKIATPESVPRLFNLIQPKDPRFAPAFFKAVGNTLVANDLEQANRIAFGQRRWRVATFTGQLINT
ncbi:Smc hinge domain-containing protein, partial [Rickenella mellea]